MAAGIEDYQETYQQAYKAYVQQNYEKAAALVDQIVESDDPNIHLLRGHVYYVLQQYDIAIAEYKQVLRLSDDQEIISCAKSGLENIGQYQQFDDDSISGLSESGQIDFSDFTAAIDSSESESFSLGKTNPQGDSFDLNVFAETPQAVEFVSEAPNTNPFDMPTDSTVFCSTMDSTGETGGNNPFEIPASGTYEELNNSKDYGSGEFEFPALWQDELEQASFSGNTNNVSQDVEDIFAVNTNPSIEIPNNNNSDNNSSPFAQVELPSSIPSTSDSVNSGNKTSDSQFSSSSNGSYSFKPPITVDDETLLMGKTDLKNNLSNSLSNSQNNSQNTSQNDLHKSSQSNSQKNSNNLKFDSPEKQTPTPETKNAFTLGDFLSGSDFVSTEKSAVDTDDSFDLEAFESAFGSQDFAPSQEMNSFAKSEAPKNNNIEFLDDFDEFDDLGNIPGFDITGNSGFSDASINSVFMPTNGNGKSKSKILQTPPPENASDNSRGGVGEREGELFSITGSQEAVPVFTSGDVSKIEPQVSIEQGFFAPIENASLKAKPWFVAGAVGIVSSLVVAGVSYVAANFAEPQQRSGVQNTGWAMSLAAGLASFTTASMVGNVANKQIRRTTQELQAQFDAVRQGNLNVQATVYSEDELGKLAAGFNEMARVISTTTSEATRKAEEQEEAKENLQRQVIRLLDDVEGAARGDLTVQAEVTADVLGAVADAFNLTIQNLRDIVQQVKVAAREVTKGSTNSETFARALSTDALRQAEELAVTLNSVQVMTDSIQRVAFSAREAEKVARDASTIAVKGGEAVENTVAGILEIRETVAETTRKVKRLAESSQEISKIVALISQIASRTNLLALNASIEAARAGEAGRGFAIVADEVRQLADKSAKSLKEIEQIVMQIQSETSSVMTAMEEGTQQVIKGTRLAEEAKRSLENIIQVANRIDSLVGSITSDTVEQTETSRAVAQVMQSVELTAQETSQEAQRVSGALQHLVAVSRDLISSVERFRVETTESR
ncbi:MAG: HAMP domain-containing protein [Scytonematopsis contorta HA4267-MV1]|jgi:twitching motility protein PilJ|nr:HAMP domain-containing protein [Scytonematopsis contorta HA4267-MV1]